MKYKLRFRACRSGFRCHIIDKLFDTKADLQDYLMIAKKQFQHYKTEIQITPIKD